MTKAVADALVKNDELIALVATFVLNYVQKCRLASKRKKKVLDPR